jgi:ferredoxin-nitrite reductase
MERLFGAYTGRRNPDESFLNFTRRHSIADLQGFCRTKEIP